jgi:hypothetical protein
VSQDKQKVSETQVGAIGEGLVASQLILASAGRLSPYRPVADDSGIDLLVLDKKTGRVTPIQVKSRTKRLRRHPKIVHFQTRIATFREYKGGFLLAVLIDLETLEVQRAWLIPMKRLSGVARRQGDNLVIRPSIDMHSTDQYSAFRCEDLNEVTRRLTTTARL